MHAGTADVFTVAEGALRICRRALERRVGLFAESGEPSTDAARGACEMAATEVHQEGAKPGRAGAGRIDAFLSGRAALHSQQAAHHAEEIRVRRRVVLVELEVAGLEALGAQNAPQRLRNTGSVGGKKRTHDRRSNCRTS